MGRACFSGLLGTAVALGIGVLAHPASAAGRVLTGASGTPKVTELRLAHAASPAWERTWAQYRLSGGGRVAIVTAVRPGTHADPAPDAWFEALEAATAPRVVPPPAVPECGNGAATVHVTGDLSHVPSLPPSEVAVLGSLDALSDFAAARQLDFDAADAAALGEHAAPFLALVYEPSGGSTLTEAVRLAAPGASEPIALSLAASSGDEPDVTLWTFGSGRAALAGITEHTPDAVGFSFVAKTGISDYPERRRELLTADHGAAWLIETSGSAPLFQLGVLPKQGGAIPPIASEYFDRAAVAGLAPSPSTSCFAGALDARAAGKSGASVAERCPKGLLAVVPGSAPACDPEPAEGEIDSDALICGDAEDLAHALAGGRPDQARVTRHRGVVGVDTADPEIELHDGTALPRVLTASDTDLSGCATEGTGGSGGATGSGAYSGSSGTWGYGGSGGDGYYAPEPETHTEVNVSCWGSSEPSSEGDSCSGDSSSSSEGDSCSGDSSDGAEGGEACSGDSSDGADGGDACSGDSSSGSGDGCSGDSSGGGDGCSGDTGSSGGDCSVSERRPRRIRLQIWLVGAAALAFAWRRLSRPRARH